MPSLQQVRAVSGRGTPTRIEDLNQARLPSLYASRSQAFANQEMDLAEEGLALRRREGDLARSQENSALLTQGASTAISGVGLLETAYPGTLKSLGAKFLPGAAAAPAIAPSIVAPAAGALPGGTGLAAAYPLFGGASEAALGAAAPVASGAATASGIAGAPSAAAATIAPSIGATTGTAGAAGTAAGAGGATLGGVLGPAGIGFGAGALVGKPLGQLFGLKGRAAGALGGGIAGGVTGGALVGTGIFPGIGTALGAALGAVSGALGGAISIIATVTYGADSPETRLAQAFRRKYVGATTFKGYHILFGPLAQFLESHPERKASVKQTLVDPMLRAMQAELDGLPARQYRDERTRLRGILVLCRQIGAETRRGQPRRARVATW